MKGFTVFVIAGMIVLSAASFMHRGAAELQVPEQVPRIGVVSMMRLLRDSQRASQRQRQFEAEQEQITGELTRLNQELESDQAKLKAFKQGSPEYMDLYKAMVEKQAKLQALQEYHRQASAAKERQWTEQLYKEILQAVTQVAQQKGLSLVLEWTEPEFPIPPERFVATINTQKVLYAKGCVDITADVMAIIDQK
ncbi:MAG: OmpH family outer membrane protein [Sedimentisphaerales bacterium]|nr:OmpH family outer membrane protein [Sedimentisphaerales bacterium]